MPFLQCICQVKRIRLSVSGLLYSPLVFTGSLWGFLRSTQKLFWQMIQSIDFKSNIVWKAFFPCKVSFHETFFFLLWSTEKHTAFRNVNWSSAVIASVLSKETLHSCIDVKVNKIKPAVLRKLLEDSWKSFRSIHEKKTIFWKRAWCKNYTLLGTLSARYF